MSKFNRNNSLGGSDAAIILNMNKWSTPLDLWLDKKHGIREFVDNRFAEWGNRLEPAVAKKYKETCLEEWGVRVKYWTPRPKKMKGERWAHASPDRLVEDVDTGKKWGLEIKTCVEYNADQWGPSMSNEYPRDYYIQCVWYMMVWDLDRWDLAALIGGSGYRFYTIERDRDTEEWLLGVTREWWRRHVELGEEPVVNITGMNADAHEKTLRRMYPVEVGSTIVATPDIIEVAVRAAEIKKQVRALEKEYKPVKVKITDYMKEHGTLDCGEDVGTIEYKVPKTGKGSRRFNLSNVTVSEKPNQGERDV